MESKTIARVGAIAFVAIAITMTALQLRDDPKSLPADNVVTVVEPDGDPLPAILRDCAALGEAGAHDRGCLAAWAESRRRFLAPGGTGKVMPDTTVRPKPADAMGNNTALSPDEVQ
jgi:conjugative transfer region protein TrbK